MRDYKINVSLAFVLIALMMTSCKDTTTTKTNADGALKTHSQVTYSANDREVVGLILSIQKIDNIYGELAKAKAHTPELKEALGRVLHTSEQLQSQTTAVLQKLQIEEKGSPAMKRLLSDMHRYIKILKKKSGREFDRAYLKNQLRFDQFRIDILKEKLIPKCDNEKLKTLLTSFLPSYRQEMTLLEKTLTELSN